MSKAPKKTSIEIPSVAHDRAINAAARADPDAQPLLPSQLEAMVPLRTVRGRPKSEHRKLLVSVRYSPEVLRAERHQRRRRWMLRLSTPCT